MESGRKNQLPEISSPWENARRINLNLQSESVRTGIQDEELALARHLLSSGHSTESADKLVRRNRFIRVVCKRNETPNETPKEK